MGPTPTTTRPSTVENWGRRNCPGPTVFGDTSRILPRRSQFGHKEATTTSLEAAHYLWALSRRLADADSLVTSEGLQQLVLPVLQEEHLGVAQVGWIRVEPPGGRDVEVWLEAGCRQPLLLSRTRLLRGPHENVVRDPHPGRISQPQQRLPRHQAGRPRHRRAERCRSLLCRGCGHGVQRRQASGHSLSSYRRS
jgi:hypothetical protein